MEAHGTISNPQHRVQAPGGAGLCGRETLYSLARRHDLVRNLIGIWIQKFEAGALDEEAIAADTIEGYEARIAALGLLLPPVVDCHSE
jgi:transposase-like protein